MASIDQLPDLVRAARIRAGLTQLEAARRVGVSHRLWAEVEQGRRPNVSFSTMVRMLNEVGMRVSVSSPALDRAARASKRRATWVGAQARLGDDDSDPTAPARRSDRLGAVAAVSRNAFALGEAGRATPGRGSPHAGRQKKRR